MTGEAPPAAPKPKARVTAKRQRALDDANAKRKKAARQAKSEAVKAEKKVRRKPDKSADGRAGDTEFRRAGGAALALIRVQRLTNRGVSERMAAGLLGHRLAVDFLRQLKPEATAAEAAALALQLLDKKGKGPTGDDGPSATERKAIRRNRARAAPLADAVAARRGRAALASFQIADATAFAPLMWAYDTWFYDTPAGRRGGTLTEAH